MASLEEVSPEPGGTVAEETVLSAARTARALAARALDRANALRAAGAWTEADEAELDERFEIAATAALRVPALAERSARLRRVGRRFVPRQLRPGLRRAAGALDKVAGLVLSRLEAARRSRS